LGTFSKNKEYWFLNPIYAKVRKRRADIHTISVPCEALREILPEIQDLCRNIVLLVNEIYLENIGANTRDSPETLLQKVLADVKSIGRWHGIYVFDSLDRGTVLSKLEQKARRVGRDTMVCALVFDYGDKYTVVLDNSEMMEIRWRSPKPLKKWKEVKIEELREVLSVL
jgi:hypothetical protein